jgi:hypothetical protein
LFFCVLADKAVRICGSKADNFGASISRIFANVVVIGAIFAQGEEMTFAIQARSAMKRGELIHAWFSQISWIEDGLPTVLQLLSASTGLGSHLSEEQAMKEATRAFSLGEKSSQDTAIRKAQSVARNNVNANYGQRKTVAEALNAYNPNIMPAIYGQALNTWSPRGLAGHIPTAELLTSIATGNLSPLAAIPFSSPRAMGEAAYYGGKAAGAISNVANATKLNPMSLKLLGYPGRIPGLLGQ